MLKHQNIKYQKERAKLLAEDTTLDSIGEVFISCDTANVTILTKHGKRFMVTSEYMELMEPQNSCFQNNIKKTMAQMGRIFND